MPFNYLVTIKPTKARFVGIQELETSLDHARSLYPKADWHSESGKELDCINRLHLHTMVKFPNNISMKKHTDLFKLGDLRIHFKKIPQKDFNKAYNYCLKEKTPNIKEQISEYHWLQKKLKTINLFKKA